MLAHKGYIYTTSQEWSIEFVPNFFYCGFGGKWVHIFEELILNDSFYQFILRTFCKIALGYM